MLGLFSGCNKVQTTIAVDDGSIKKVNVTNPSLNMNCLNCGSGNTSLTIPNPLNVTVKNTALKIYGNTNTTILNPQRNVNATLLNFPRLVNTTESDIGKVYDFSFTGNNQRQRIDVNGSNAKGFTIMINDTFVGTFTFYGSNNGILNTTMLCYPLGGGAGVTTATAGGHWWCPAVTRYVIIGTTAYTSGSPIRVRAYQSTEQAQFIPNTITAQSTGTYAVTQSGTWTVGLTATQRVNVSADIQNAQSVKTIDVQHANLHAGRDWLFSDVVYLTANSNVTYSLNVTGVANRQPHFYFEIGGEQTANCTLNEAPTTSGGTLMTQYQRNRNTGTTTSPSMYIYKSPTVTARGTIINNFWAFASGIGARQSSDDRDLNEWVLKTSTKYLITCKNMGSSAGLFNIGIDYYYLG
jgi:hypothetical protein